MTDVVSDIDLASRRGTFAGLSPLVGIVLFGFLAIGAPLPVLSLYVHDELHFSGGMVGLVIGLQSLTTVLSRHRAGVLVDRRGPRPAVLLGLPIAALSGALYLASTPATLSPEIRLTILIAGRILMGLGESLFLTGTMSWGIGRIGVNRTGRVMSWQGIALYAAFGFGAPLGLAIYAVAGFAGVSALAIVMPLLALPIALALRPVTATGGDRVPFYRVLGLIWLPGTVLMLATVAFAGMAAFLPLAYAAKGWSGAGLAMTGFGIGYILMRLVGSHLPDRHSAVSIVSVSLGVEALGQLALWLATQPLVALAGSALTGVGFSLVFPALGVLATRLVPATQRGRAIGNFIAFFDVAVGVTAPAVGLIAGAAGYGSTFLIGLISTIAAGALLPMFRRITMRGSAAT